MPGDCVAKNFGTFAERCQVFVDNDKTPKLPCKRNIGYILGFTFRNHSIHKRYGAQASYLLAQILDQETLPIALVSEPGCSIMLPTVRFGKHTRDNCPKNCKGLQFHDDCGAQISLHDVFKNCKVSKFTNFFKFSWICSHKADLEGK